MEEFSGLALRASAMFVRFQHGSQSLVHRLRLRKRLGNIGLQDNKLRAFGKTLGVLPTLGEDGDQETGSHRIIESTHARERA